MDAENHIERRLTELEIKACFSEDLVDRLNEVIVQQQQTIERLARDLEQLRQQSALLAPAAVGSLRDELPPHY